jgi:hypothetical protein
MKFQTAALLLACTVSLVSTASIPPRLRQAHLARREARTVDFARLGHLADLARREAGTLDFAPLADLARREAGTMVEPLEQPSQEVELGRRGGGNKNEKNDKKDCKELHKLFDDIDEEVAESGCCSDSRIVCVDNRITELFVPTSLTK